MNNIKYLFLDVDGTLTDGNIYISSSGELFKAFNVKDGYAIHDILPSYNIEPVIITSRKSKIVEQRCNELGIKHCYQGYSNKKNLFMDLMCKFGIPFIDEKYISTAYVGDDINDIESMKLCSVICCPANSCNEVKEIADYVSPISGGNGAVRDCIEFLIKNNT